MEQEQLRGLLDISVEAADYLLEKSASGAPDEETRELLDNLRQIAALVETEMQAAEGGLRQIYLYAKNVQASLDDIDARPERFARIICMEIRPFVREMQQLWAFQTDVLASGEHIAAYRRNVMEQMEALHDAPQEEYPYEVSIVLLGYNKLEYTKCAAESILAHTDFSRGNVELIVLNNGSDDGTREYFEQLPHAKVMNLKHNILGTYAYTHVVTGKYFLGFSNDVVATPHWLDHLLACMKSDARIAMAVPTCNEGSISNLQGVPIPYRNTFEDMEKMQVFAADFNRLNPRLWEDRSQLMTFLAIMRSDMIRLIAADPVFTKAEFVDDDMSTALRRTGWRQVLLKDTFMHHFGGVTLSADRVREKGNALDAMRRVYYDKWGVDAWDSRGCFPGVENIWDWHAFAAGERVLMLEPRFGDLACQIYNRYRMESAAVHMTAAVFDERYLPDTDYLFDATIAADSIGDAAARCAAAYDLISAGCYLDELPLGDVIANLEQLYGLLAPGGLLLLPVRNPGSAYELSHLMNTGMRAVYMCPDEVKRFSSIAYKNLLAALHAHPQLHSYRTYSIMFEADQPLAEKLKPLLELQHDVSREEAELSLHVHMFFLGISKPSV
ncbi:glycosyltransferase [Selenomonas sp. oral taxon 137]|uniref:glycosyltransferase n=1 Tax=Selenomonas sp. oral taxon 137 TaxID=712531 RepID=UPI00055EB7D1|nr:glycosyltransferase [Selenomonas sp. oral taxon 137]